MKKHLFLLLVMVIAIQASYAQLPSYLPDSGLVAWYPFNGNANDESGNGNNGTVSSATLTTDRHDQANSAYHWNYAGYIRVADNSLLDFTSEFTISLWANPETGAMEDPVQGDWLVAKWGGNSGASYGITFMKSGTTAGAFRFITHASQPAHLNFLCQSSIHSTDEWYFITATKSSDGYIRIFVNGIIEDSSQMIQDVQITTTDLCFGIHDIGSWVNYIGNIDDIALYNRALNNEEIIGLYNEGQVFYSESQVNIKVFPQSVWESGDSLSTILNALNMIPGNQVYDNLPWSYNGQESLSSIPSDMVDWVLVELRTAIDTVIERRAGILRNDGIICDTNGQPGLQFSSDSGDYYIAVRHRNHLPVMTANKVPVPSSTLYDFTDTLNLPQYGNCGILLSSGHYAMIAGDVSQDGILKYSGNGNDRALVLQRLITETGSTVITSTVQGYFSEDINMDGTVKYTGAGNDPSTIISNLINKTGSTSITNTLSGCAPEPYITPVQTFKTCGDTLLDMRDYQKYATVQIGTQCWMAENLNVGMMVLSTEVGSNSLPHSDMFDNGTIEKYCYENNYAMCSIYGGLYEWDEAMNYSQTGSSPDICPSGWHIPTHDEL